MEALTQSEVELGGAVANAYSEQYGSDTAIVRAEFDGIDVAVVAEVSSFASLPVNDDSVVLTPLAMLLNDPEVRGHLDELDLPNLDFVTAFDHRNGTRIEAAVMVTEELMDHLNPGEDVETV